MKINVRKTIGKFGAVLFCLLEAVVGTLLLINPVGFTTGIIMIIGAALIVYAALSVIGYFRTPAAEAAKGQLLTRGLISLMIGLVGILGTKWLLAVFPLITMLYGIIMLVAGVSKIQFGIDSVRLKQKRWFLRLISAAVSIICALVIILNPFASTAALWIFIGIAMLVDAAFDLIAVFLIKRIADQTLILDPDEE